MNKEQMINRVIDGIYALSLGQIDINADRDAYHGTNVVDMKNDLYRIHERALELYVKNDEHLTNLDFLEGRKQLLDLYAPWNLEGGKRPHGWDEHIAKLKSAGLSYMIEAYVAGVPVDHIIAGDGYEIPEDPFLIP